MVATVLIINFNLHLYYLNIVHKLESDMLDSMHGYIHCGQISTPPRTVPPRSMLASQMYLQHSVLVDDKFTLSTLLPCTGSVMFTSSRAASLMTTRSIAWRSVLPAPVWVNSYQSMSALDLGSPLPLHPMWIMVSPASFADWVFPSKV